VVAMCDRVLPAGVIVSTEDKQGGIQTENSDDANQLNIPIALLINGNSASASEVFVGAIQDYGMGVVVGEQSFGKGIVQSIFQLSDGSGLKFTTENYYTPSGRSIQDVGITPDIQVSIPDEAYDDGVLSEEEDTQLQAAIDALLGK
ncbi:MAG: carboxy- processing protease, partial [Lachnospiraceae bacterium]|nr:carboxy- processing protease [Lachnospiraceae bacterium]